MIRKNIIKEESAISPIIGTILMVAITVIMAAIISSWSSGIKAPDAPVSVGIDINRLDQTSVQVTFTSIDPPTLKLKYLNFSEPGNTTPTFARMAELSSGAGIAMGNSTTLTVSGWDKFITGVATFSDLSGKTVYAQKI